MIGLIAITEWTAWISNYGSWAAARCLYGFFVAPVEVLPEISVPDVFFAHERGTYISLYMLTLSGSNFLAPLIAGFMNDGIGWRSVQHLGAILLGVNFILALFFQEESMYSRGTVEAEEVDSTAPYESFDGAITDEKSKSPVDAKDGGVTSALPVANSLGLSHTKKTFRQKLALWSYSGVTRAQFFRMVYRPVLIFFQFPNVMWAGFNYGSALAWYNVYNATVSLILSSEPYGFSPSIVGLTYVAPLIGTLIGGFFTGTFSDWYTLKLAHRNGGLREPEQRLWGLVIYCIFITVGLALWGVGAANELHWAVLLLGAIFCGYCNVAGGAYSLAYTVDCFKEIAGESIVSVILCRNTMSFAFNYAITPWIEAQGLEHTFIAVSILAFAFGASFLLMIWKGKSLRIFSADRYWRYAATQAVAISH